MLGGRTWRDPWGMQRVLEPPMQPLHLPPLHMAHVIYAAGYDPHPQVRKLANYILTQHQYAGIHPGR